MRPREERLPRIGWTNRSWFAFQRLLVSTRTPWQLTSIVGVISNAPVTGSDSFTNILNEMRLSARRSRGASTKMILVQVYCSGETRQGQLRRYPAAGIRLESMVREYSWLSLPGLTGASRRRAGTGNRLTAATLVFEGVNQKPVRCMLALSASSMRAMDSLKCARVSRDILMPGLVSALCSWLLSATRPCRDSVCASSGTEEI